MYDGVYDIIRIIVIDIKAFILESIKTLLSHVLISCYFNVSNIHFDYVYLYCKIILKVKSP